jgi:hypothetical protein
MRYTGSRISTQTHISPRYIQWYMTVNVSSEVSVKTQGTDRKENMEIQRITLVKNLYRELFDFVGATRSKSSGRHGSRFHWITQASPRRQVTGWGFPRNPNDFDARLRPQGRVLGACPHDIIWQSRMREGNTTFSCSPSQSLSRANICLSRDSGTSVV